MVAASGPSLRSPSTTTDASPPAPAPPAVSRAVAAARTVTASAARRLSANAPNRARSPSSRVENFPPGKVSNFDFKWVVMTSMVRSPTLDLRVQGGAAHRGRVHGGVVDLDRAQTGREHRHLLHRGEFQPRQQPDPDPPAVRSGGLHMPPAAGPGGEIGQGGWVADLLYREHVRGERGDRRGQWSSLA